MRAAESDPPANSCRFTKRMRTDVTGAVGTTSAYHPHARYTLCSSSVSRRPPLCGAVDAGRRLHGPWRFLGRFVI